MNIKTYFRIFIIAAIVSSGFCLKGQTLLCDSTVLKLTGYQDGLIQWQESTDGITFTDIPGATAAQTTVFTNTNKFFRAFVTSGTCAPYFSDTISDFKPLPFTQAETDTIFNDTASTLMRVLNIYLQPDSMILRTLSTDVSLCDTVTLYQLRSRMLKTVQNPLHPGVGIAAPQVGINRRAVYVKRYDKYGAPFEFYVNIRIKAMSDTVKLRSDGCLSVPTGSPWPTQITQTYRAIWVVVEYNLIDGTHVTERINHEYTAHIFQHEIDHLDTIMYFDHPGAKQLKILHEPKIQPNR
jgi:peptide deformylase